MKRTFIYMTLVLVLSLQMELPVEARNIIVAFYVIDLFASIINKVLIALFVDTAVRNDYI